MKQIAEFIELIRKICEDRFTKLETLMKNITAKNMDQKTKMHAGDGKQELVITREFDLPLGLLFKAYTDHSIVAQWMGTKVLKLENKKHGGYQFETTDPQGNVVFRANGTIHEFVPNQKIIRTFEMDHTPFGVQLEIYEFEQLTDNTSKLNMHVIYESVAQRDQLLQLPFAQNLNMAHNRIQEILKLNTLK
ncbi:SRPBCC domain-containing protein [Chitinophaga sp. MM2321]|uniref:SRPBCC family protein n=1 Tax=Chitinophaga sp. MM2321 TaxID=3137178 RepID=UPI0032D58F36